MATQVQTMRKQGIEQGAQNAQQRRWDIIAMWAGVAFSFGFTMLIWAMGGLLSDVPHLPDQGAAWYYWKLPEPLISAQITAWGFYLAHQLSIWILIYYAQMRVKKYTKGLHKVNIVALAVTAFFIVLHLIQTHVWYDGLAQDTSIFSSQGAVIVMLVWIMLMENTRRGVFFGKKVPMSKKVTHFARKYHGYFFAWAIIYTFWFHPMEATSGHLVGFFYTFLLMLQGSLFFTRIHINKWWMLTQEVIVLAHGTMVAIVGGTDLWTMFFFGFAGIFVITQMHGLGLSRWVRWLIFGGYIAGAIAIYSWKGFDHLWELSAIPIIDYIALFVLAALIWLGLKIYGLFANRSKSDTVQAAQA